RDAAVELAEQRESGLACQRDDSAGPGNGLGESEDAAIGGERVGAEAIVVDAVERGGLGVEIEERCGAIEGRGVLWAGGSGEDDDDLAAGLAIGLHVGSGSPGA